MLTHPPTTKWRYPTITRALPPEVFDTVWAGVEALLPVHNETHPLGCHRRGPSHSPPRLVQIEGVQEDIGELLYDMDPDNSGRVIIVGAAFDSDGTILIRRGRQEDAKICPRWRTNYSLEDKLYMYDFIPALRYVQQRHSAFRERFLRWPQAKTSALPRPDPADSWRVHRRL